MSLTRALLRGDRILPSLTNYLSSVSRSRGLTTRSAMDVLANSDPEQVRLMEERVILVDANDNVRGNMSKKDSHLLANDLPLHRAFSLFLFDTEGRMLLQQRAATKVTFPSYWTNTVCSHPLCTPQELGDDQSDPVLGAKRAAIRKSGHELGINIAQLDPSDLHFLTRIHYRATSDQSMWGEHELDYIFFAQKQIPLEPQPNEVSNVRYVNVAELKALYDDEQHSESLKITPWFKHIMHSFGWQWWEVLLRDGLSALPKLQDAQTIHRMGACGEHCSS